MPSSTTALRMRGARPDDVADCVRLRGRTRENAVSEARLAAVGITVASWSAQVARGELWGVLLEGPHGLAGYCFGDVQTGEIVVMVVAPEAEGQGWGRRLLTEVVDELFRRGHRRLVLGCSDNPQHRSWGFYRALGWQPTGRRDGHGDEELALERSGVTGESPQGRG